jgi:uncharacterized membrane protein
MTDAQVAAQAPGVSQEQQPQRSRAWRGVLLALIALAANICIAADLNFPIIVPALGVALFIGLPTALLMVKVDWRADATVERLGLSLMTTLLLVMLGGLLINTILPPFGIKDALGHIPVLILGDTFVVALLLWRRERPAWRPSRGLWSIRLTTQEKTVTRLAAASAGLAVIGANRLNNGTGDGVTVVMLGLVFVTIVLLFLWRDKLDEGVVMFVIYALSLALLLATSMRGLYTTGHDIQREYRVFELTKANGNWSISRFRDAYNACLSITILPTILWDATKIHDPYVYKVLYQAMFALCPPLVYRLSLRFTTPTVGLIGITYLLAFPTFANDMPFLNRQEIAFLFVVVILLILTNEAMPLTQKRLWIAAFSLGLIVSHYSTAAVFIATILAIVAIRLLIRAGNRWFKRTWHRLHLPKTRLGDTSARPVFSVLNIVVLILGAELWIGVITQTGSSITSTLTSAASSIGQTLSFSAKSSDVAYNLFSFSQPSTTQLLNEYRQHTTADTGSRNGYYPISAVDARAPTQTADIAAPLSTAGTDLKHLGINVTSVQTIIHGGAAKLLQLLVLIGLIAALFAKDVRFRMRREPYLFAAATLIVLVAEVIVPVVSEDYGILRAFMQGLLILSPILAYGSLVVFAKLGGRWAARAAIGLALFLFVSLSGLLSQLLGGYQQQLSLDNSGLYYDVYYPHTQEIVGINWLRDHIPPRVATSVQSETFTDEFEFQELRIYNGINPANDIFPTLLRRNSYVFLGFATVRHGRATFAYKGNLITYSYPTSFLTRTKDLLFNDGGAEIYR